jgi:hypothetical protein
MESKRTAEKSEARTTAEAVCLEVSRTTKGLVALDLDKLTALFETSPSNDWRAKALESLFREAIWSFRAGNLTDA